MDKKTYYTVYRVTNKVNGKVYIGCHKTRNLDDGYMGSGKYLKRAIEKHGIDKFEKEILFVYDNPEEMFAKEAELVTEDFIAEENTYNLKVGGMGGWDYANSTMNSNLKSEYGKMGYKVSLERYGNEWIKKGRKRAKERIKEIIESNPNYFKDRASRSFVGRTHTEESKDKMSKTHRERLKDPTNNSQYGTRWIHSLEEKRSKKIKKDEPLPEGWKEGRKMKFD